MADTKLGLCIVGCGTFAHAHARVAAQRPERLRLYFASRSADQAAAYAHHYGAAGSFGSYETAARDPRVQALLVCTPHALHPQHLALAATAGKHVLMEKPIATTLESARTMQTRAQEAGIRFAVAENYRYMPTVRAATALIRSGRIGPLRSLHLQTTKYQRSTGWRLSRALMGGGALIDAGIHKLAAIRMMMGDPYHVSAIAPAKVFPEMEGEEAVSLWATCATGEVATLNYSWAARGEPGTQHCLVIGTEGYLQFDFYGASLQLWAAGTDEQLAFDADLDGLGAMLEGFLDLVTQGTPVATPPEEAIRDLQFVFAAYASLAAGGRPVGVARAAESPQNETSSETLE
jgi:predicted dehydrogenase